MNRQELFKLKKCIGILQIIFAFFMIVSGLIASIMLIISYLNRFWTGEEVFFLVYFILTAVIGGLLMLLGERMTGAYVVTDEPKRIKTDKEDRQVKELLIAILNIVYILLSVSVIIVLTFGAFNLYAFLCCCLPLLPSISVVVLALISLSVGKKIAKQANTEEQV